MRPTCCAPPTTRAAVATGSSPSSAPPTSPMTPTHDRAGDRAVGPARATERDDQGSGNEGRGPRDRGAHRAWRQRQRHAAVLGRPLRAGDRRLHMPASTRGSAGEPVDAIASVASFFVSRVDAKADALLPPGLGLRGRVAIANARRAYARYLVASRTALAAARARRRAPATTALGQYRHQGPRLFGCALRRGADPHGRGQHDARGDATGLCRPRPGRTTSSRPRSGPRRSCAARGKRASTSTPSPHSSSARASARSATPTTSCSNASRQRRRGSPPRAEARSYVPTGEPTSEMHAGTHSHRARRRRPLGAWFTMTSARPGPSVCIPSHPPSRGHARATDRVLPLRRPRSIAYWNCSSDAGFRRPSCASCWRCSTAERACPISPRRLTRGPMRSAAPAEASPCAG